MELWELIARESIRDRIARWNAHGDAGRFDEMVMVLAPDAEFQAAGSDLLHGRDAVLGFLNGIDGRRTSDQPTPRPPGRYVPSGGRQSLRHYTSTIRIDFESETLAEVRSYYAVLSSHGLDHWGRYLDEFRPVDGEWLITKRTITTEGVDPEGWAAPLQ